MKVSTDTLIVSRRGHVVNVTLNRPQHLNALDVEMMGALRGLWQDLHADADVRCVTLTGAGKGFCSGADVAMLSKERRVFGLTAQEELQFLPGRQLDIPIIVGVNGVCAGGGLHFVADSDIAIAADTAYFLDSHVSVGQVSALEPMSLLVRARSDAIMRMVLLGRQERVDATEARRIGLVSEVIPEGDLRHRLDALADIICASSPAAVRTSRRLLRSFMANMVDAALEDAWHAIRAHWEHPDSREGPRAFREHREPRWQ